MCHGLNVVTVLWKYSSTSSNSLSLTLTTTGTRPVVTNTITTTRPVVTNTITTTRPVVAFTVHVAQLAEIKPQTYQMCIYKKELLCSDYKNNSLKL